MIEYLIDGPLWYFSLAVFCIGVLWQLAQIVFTRGKTDLSVARGSASSGAIRNVFSRFVPHREIAPHIRLQVVAGYMFHLGLFALLFFAAPHVIFLEENLLGFGWTPMPHWAFIVDDHVATILTFVVMLTGCLALLKGHSELRLLHRFTVELLLIYFPFSCLMHTFTFIPSRAFTGAWFGRRGIDA